MENIDDKNPKNVCGRTPLHYAADNGHGIVCKLIIMVAGLVEWKLQKDRKERIGYNQEWQCFDAKIPSKG